MTVARREFLARVRSRWFLFSTLVVPVLFLGGIILPAVLVDRSTEDPKPIVVIDNAGNGIADRLIDSLRANEIPAELLVDRARPTTEDAFDMDSLRSRIAAGNGSTEAEKAAAWLYLPGNLIEEGTAVLVEDRDTGPVLRRRIASSLQQVVTAARLERASVGRATIETALRPTSVSVEPLSAKDGPAGLRQALGFVFAMALYVMFIVYGQMIARGVLEEKTSDIVEILISSLRPWEMMLGKILGIGAVGLTQFLIWAILMAAVSAPGMVSAMGMGDIGLPTVPIQLLVFFVVFFVLGFLLYGTLYAGIGAAFDTEQEAQNFQGVVTMLLIVPLVLMMQILNQPDGTLSVVLSLFPFFTPMLMFLRMTLTQVPPIQLAASVVLMVGAILACTWIVAKIYRVGILMHGSKPKFKELVRWVREA